MLGNYTKPKSATNYKAFDYSENLKTKYIYGNVILDNNLQISKSTYLSKISMISNGLKCKMEENLDKILGENSGFVKRNIASEIQKI